MKTVLLAVAAVVALTTAACAAPVDDASDTDTSSDELSAGMLGSFTSTTCEQVGDGTFQIRHYKFSSAGGEVHWERFSNSVCSDDSKLMTIFMGAKAKPTGLSHQVLGGINLTVSVVRKTITPTEAGLAYLQDGSACGDYPWQADTETEFTTGCGALLQQTDDCAAEYDLLKVTHRGLIFGDRSEPLCSAATRPTKLSQFAVTLDPFGYKGPATF